MEELDWGHINQEDCVIRYVAGAHLYGIDDPLPAVRDEVAVVIEPADAVINTGRVAPRTYETDGLRLTDLGLREFVRRLLDGNLTTLVPLLAPEPGIVYRSQSGSELFGEPDDFLREQMQPTVLSYLVWQRNELASAQDGSYDADSAFTALRVGHQAIEAFEDTRVTLPAPEPLRSRLREVRAGSVSRSSVLNELDEVIRRFRVVPIVLCSTPLGLSYQQAVVGTYLGHWQENWKPIWFE